MDGDEIPANGAPMPDHLLLRCFAGADGEALLTEDNGRLPNDPAYSRAVTQIRMNCGESLQIIIDPVEGERTLIPAGRRYTVEIIGIGNSLPDLCGCDYRASYDDQRRALTLELDAAAIHGVTIRWNRLPAAPELAWKDRLRDLLIPAQIDFDLKRQAMEAARRNEDRTCFLAQLHTLSLPEALYGAVLELLSAC